MDRVLTIRSCVSIRALADVSGRIDYFASSSVLARMIIASIISYKSLTSLIYMIRVRMMEGRRNTIPAGLVDTVRSHDCPHPLKQHRLLVGSQLPSFKQLSSHLVLLSLGKVSGDGQEPDEDLTAQQI
jgi:hypothetical protein